MTPSDTVVRTLVTVVLMIAPARFASGQVEDLAVLDREMARLAAMVDGTIGVGVIHLETGRETYLNGDEAFPMASTYKVPIAVQLLARVQAGDVRLDSLVRLTSSDLHPGSGTIAYLLDDPGVILSVRNLLELMLLISDNSATDIVLRTAGGADAVNARLATLRVTGVRVDRPTVNLIADWIGLDTPDLPSLSRDSIQILFGLVTGEEREAAATAFTTDRRDTATPRGMAHLLSELWHGRALNTEGTALLLDIMTRSTTGTGRIKGLLPPGTEVAHKTGTIGATTNDVGIITLPDAAGHVVVALFVKDSERSVADRERAIAQISRAVHDYFLFHRE